ncbi:hypothetical protein M514_04327 [Trichuris suis]|uniref:Uncharacterized protein n=1 Tax=Trichuris suis TaxID=68888 RepID=A0A085MCE7_9BILA|nr:hypothetical protein M513_04327 [Trichuris suis]KFD61783.1 hypothetical protein M514_04327 [Trichuris suis]
MFSWEVGYCFHQFTAVDPCGDGLVRFEKLVTDSAFGIPPKRSCNAMVFGGEYMCTYMAARFLLPYKALLRALLTLL